MRLKHELLAMVGMLLALNLIMAFGAVVLLARMGPAVGTILRENADSIQAADEMLMVLARLGGEPSEAVDRETFLAAFERAQSNITLPDERDIVGAIGQHLEAALAGNAVARYAIVAHLRQLLAVNRAAMERGGVHAQQLGTSGAWAVVIVGIVFFALSLIVLIRVQRRFLDPVTELHDTLSAASHGDPWRRCRKMDAPIEVVDVAAAVNELLDERVRSN